MDDLAESPDVVLSAPLNTMKLAPVTVVVMKVTKWWLVKSICFHVGFARKYSRSQRLSFIILSRKG